MGSIVSFFGADSKCGTSQTVLSLALHLSERQPRYRVLLVHAEEDFGDDYIQDIGVSMGEIKPYLCERLWDAEEIAGDAALKYGFGLIGGAGMLSSGSLYHPEMVGGFLTDISAYYDFVLCDCGSDISHGLCLGALTVSDRSFAVLSQGEKALRKYEKLKALLGKLGLCKDGIVCCKYRDDQACDTGYMARRLHMEKDRIFTVSCSPDGERAEFNRRPLMYFRGRKYTADIEKLSKEVF
ncbi:MAG: hypothetical protein IJJ48_05675 [Firmicutes bacterium]|nr:hypothetical protein [Bacillota bacterium]